MSHIEEFKRNITVIDTETTNLYPDRCEIVELAGTKWNGTGWETSSMLLGAYQGIPPEASAKNNISQRMIENLPKFDQASRAAKAIIGWPNTGWYIAHNAAYDRAALKTTFAKMESAADIKLCDDDSRWICTWRLSKRLLGHEFADVEYGLSYLRYRLDLPVPDDTEVHRAGADTLVCATLLDVLIDIGIRHGDIDPSIDLGTQLVSLSWDHLTVATWPFGKHKGLPLANLDNDYYAWALKNVSSLNENDPAYDRDLAESVRVVLEKRLFNG